MAQKPRVDDVGALEIGAPAESTPIVQVVELEKAPPASTPTPTGRRVPAYDKETGEKLPYLVPPSHLDGRFSNVVSSPPSKEGN
jgi:hypothetical protein